MVKITYDPIKEIVIKEYIRFENVEDLIYIFAQLRAGGAPVSLSWANGLVFVNSPLAPETEDIMDDFLNGKIYWTNVSFAEMPKYKPLIETRERVQVPIINLNSSPIIVQVMQWLKQQK
ncbi:MAG: hypothetical protein P8X97_04115 [Candidatus Bathyarchaeota archaeon]